MVTEITAVYRVVTPLFCAGADQQRAELRLPSFKGVLRFWWRALAWSHYGGDLGEIQQAEDSLFGSAGGGASRVVMRLAGSGRSSRMVRAGDVLHVPAGKRQVVGQGVTYLGYGLMKFDGTLERACLGTPIDFTVHLRGRDLAKGEQEMLKDALIATGMFGGMGARSRRGYGSLVIQSIWVGDREWEAPRSVETVRHWIESVRQRRYGSASEPPEYTALSPNTRHVLLSSEKKTPFELLDLVGRELVRFRSWGRNGQVLGTLTAERNFPKDHDLVNESRNGRHPERVAFGLPHNYFFSSTKLKVWVNAADAKLDRRASPLFIHVHECGDGPIAVVSFLPAKFLPDDRSDISVDRKVCSLGSESTLYKPIHDFLDRLLDPAQRKEPFTAAKEVL